MSKKSLFFFVGLISFINLFPGPREDLLFPDPLEEVQGLCGSKNKYLRLARWCADCGNYLVAIDYAEKALFMFEAMKANDYKTDVLSRKEVNCKLFITNLKKYICNPVLSLQCRWDLVLKAGSFYTKNWLCEQRLNYTEKERCENSNELMKTYGSCGAYFVIRTYQIHREWLFQDISKAWMQYYLPEEAKVALQALEMKTLQQSFRESNESPAKIKTPRRTEVNKRPVNLSIEVEEPYEEMWKPDEASELWDQFNDMYV